MTLYERVQKALTFRNLLSVILRLRDEELTDALETFLVKTQDPKDFFVLIEEEVKLGIDTSRAVDLFISLILIHHYDMDAIIQLVNTVGYNQKSIVSRKVLKKLVESRQEMYLVNFIKQFPEYRSLLPIL